MAYAEFVDGVPLTASELNDYFMKQSVMRFSSAAARTTALTGVVAEGMVSYVDATDTFEYYDGSAWKVVNMPTSASTLGGDYTITTSIASTGLVCALGANMSYEVSALLSITQSGAGGTWDITADFTYPSGADLTWTGFYNGANNVTGSPFMLSGASSGSLASLAAGVTASVAILRGLVITSSTAGNLTLRAQATANTAGTRTLESTGSNLIARRVG